MDWSSDQGMDCRSERPEKQRDREAGEMELSAQGSVGGGVWVDVVRAAALGDLALGSLLGSSLTAEVADAGVLTCMDGWGVFSSWDAGDGPVCVGARLMGRAIWPAGVTTSCFIGV